VYELPKKTFMGFSAGTSDTLMNKHWIRNIVHTTPAYSDPRQWDLFTSQSSVQNLTAGRSYFLKATSKVYVILARSYVPTVGCVYNSFVFVRAMPRHSNGRP
jgi:hypothetical protein